MPLSAAHIREAFARLSEELSHHGSRAEIVIVGGAAAVVLFGARETTKDVDAVFLKPEAAIVRAAAARVAQNLDLPPDWLNDGAKGFLVGVTRGDVLYESPYLIAQSASLEQLLAMKLSAWRDEIDRSDAALFLSRIPGTSEEVWELVKPLVAAHQIDKAWYAFQDLWEEHRGSF